MSEYYEQAGELAELITTKQRAYGDAFGQSKKVIEILYPDGIQPDQYGDALTVIRVIDKLFRIATRKEAFGENPWQDIAGYALLSVVKDKQSKRKDNYAMPGCV